MKFVIDEKIPYIKGAFEPFADVVYLPGNKISNADVRDADALIIRTRTICNEDLLEGSSIKFIATATIGYDHIDTDYCRENGIIWKNAPGCNSGSVAQYLALSLAHLAKKYNFNFADRTLGVVGVGNVGKRIVRLGEILGMRVVLNDPPVMRRGSCGFISLAGLLREADIISLHPPLICDGEDNTFHLFNDATFGKLNPNTIFINTSRGEVVETSALKNALNANKIQALVLDVWENEPEFCKDLLPFCDIATPHIAGYSADGKVNGTIMAVKAVSAFFRIDNKAWRPAPLKEPKNSNITIECKGFNNQQIIIEAISKTYNILDDDFSLRQKPELFEDLRGNYPLRREFSAFKLRLKNSNQEVVNSLNLLGFNVLTD